MTRLAMALESTTGSHIQMGLINNESDSEHRASMDGPSVLNGGGGLRSGVSFGERHASTRAIGNVRNRRCGTESG